MDRGDHEQLTVAPDGRPEAEQPRWRRDFPIDVPEDEYISRRDFTKFMVLTSLAFTVGQLWILTRSWLRREKPGMRHEIPAAAALGVGESLVFDYPGPHDPALLVRLDQNRWVAYDQKCTHLSCPVLPRIAEGRLYCPCHEGSFDLETGRPLAGPPRRPLALIRLERAGERIYATGVEERTV